MKKLLTLVAVCLAAISVSAAETTAARKYKPNTLWYDAPASCWLEALPIGNSRLGAMEYGGTAQEELQLNEETFWNGSPHSNNSTKSLGLLSEVRSLIFSGQEEKAADIINKDFIVGPHGMGYQTVGSLRLTFAGHEKATDFYRDLNIGDAVATTTYKVDGVTYTRTTFASLSDGVIVMHITADKEKALNMTVGYDSQMEFTAVAKKDMLTCSAKNRSQEGIEGKLTAQTLIKVMANGAVAPANEKSLSVKDASEATIYVSIATNFVKYNDISGNALKKAQAYLNAIKKKSYEQLLKDHVAAYQQQFNRVSLTLPTSKASALPTVQRVDDFAKKNTDQALVALMFQYGRYLLISSSQPGGQPANLQGVWNNKVNAPWDSKYTININTEMNYWPADITNLGETAEPLFSMIKDLSVTGRKTAREMYDCNGWVAHHNTDLWRIAGPVDGAPWGMFPNGGAWLSTHIWQHYLYSGDKDFLKKYYDILADVARFYFDYLQTLPNDFYAFKNGSLAPLAQGEKWLVAVPSVSPEHGPMGKRTPVTAGCTMDNQIVFDALTQALEATRIVAPQNTAFADSLQKALAQVPPMAIGQYNQLQEWMQDGDNPRDEHRHISQLYGLYPSNQISPYSHPTLFQAARNTLMQRGDMATGWSLGWKTNFWARMLDGNHAYKIISNMLNLLPNEGEAQKTHPDGRTFPNLFDAHPPFQIDGNFGVCAGIAEMLMQSHDGALHVLPALPDAWREGEVKGLLARGGFVIDDLKWSAGQMDKLTVTSRLGGLLRIRSYVPLKGNGLRPASGTNTNDFYKTAAIKDPRVSSKVTPQQPLLFKVYEYDLDTEAGKSYEVVRL